MSELRDTLLAIPRLAGGAVEDAPEISRSSSMVAIAAVSQKSSVTSTTWRRSVSKPCLRAFSA
jgi:hypothetical protein